VREWFLDVHRFSPTFEGHLEGIQDGQPVVFDTQKDLGLTKDTTKVGLALEYQGPRFGLEISMDEQDYVGSNFVTRKITVNGQDFNAGAQVDSKMKVTTTNFLWTIRALKWEQAWVGIDLGARVWAMDLQVVGNEPFSGVNASANEKFPIPIPQLGLSAGFNAFDRKVIARGYYHLLTFKGASYHHTGIDVRYFPIRWLGVRAFMDSESFDVPKGSINSDLQLVLDRKGTGFGVVLRF
jgi:hypothetical protein